MPTITIPKHTILQSLSLTDSLFLQFLFDYGIEYEYTIILNNEEYYKLDIPANRYDLLCYEGIRETFMAYIHHGKCGYKGENNHLDINSLTDNYKQDSSSTNQGVRDNYKQDSSSTTSNTLTYDSSRTNQSNGPTLDSSSTNTGKNTKPFNSNNFNHEENSSELVSPNNHNSNGFTAIHLHTPCMFPIPTISSSSYVLFQTPPPVRPFVYCFILRSVPKCSFSSLIEYQEILHRNLGRNRKNMSMGLHDAKKVKFPLYYKYGRKDQIYFTPLKIGNINYQNKTINMTNNNQDINIISGNNKNECINIHHASGNKEKNASGTKNYSGNNNNLNYINTKHDMNNVQNKLTDLNVSEPVSHGTVNVNTLKSNYFKNADTAKIENKNSETLKSNYFKNVETTKIENNFANKSNVSRKTGVDENIHLNHNEPTYTISLKQCDNLLSTDKILSRYVTPSPFASYFIDSNNLVISYPPVLNCDQTRLVDSTDVLVEMTGDDRKKLEDTAVYMIGNYGGNGIIEIEQRFMGNNKSGVTEQVGSVQQVRMAVSVHKTELDNQAGLVHQTGSVQKRDLVHQTGLAHSTNESVHQTELVAQPGLTSLGRPPSNVSHHYREFKSIKSFLSPSSTYVLTPALIQQHLNVSMNESVIVQCLHRMMYSINIIEGEILVYPYFMRRDVLGIVDVLEDVAIAYTLKQFNKLLIPFNTYGNELFIHVIEQRLREECAYAGFNEVLNLSLLSERENGLIMDETGIVQGVVVQESNVVVQKEGQESNVVVQESGEVVVQQEGQQSNVVVQKEGQQREMAVRLKNPKSVEYQVVRTSLLPGLLKFIRNNGHCALPIKIFESGDVCLVQAGDTNTDQCYHTLTDKSSSTTRTNQVNSKNSTNQSTTRTNVDTTRTDQGYDSKDHCNGTYLYNTSFIDISSHTSTSVNQKRFSGCIVGLTDHFDDLTGVINQVVHKLRVEWELDDIGKESFYGLEKVFLQKRRGKIIIQDKLVGVFGVIHPDILKQFGISQVVSSFEMDLQLIVEILEKKK